MSGLLEVLSPLASRQGEGSLMLSVAQVVVVAVALWWRRTHPVPVAAVVCASTSITMRVRITGTGRPTYSRNADPAAKNGFSSRTVISSSTTAPMATAGSGPSSVCVSSYTWLPFRVPASVRRFWSSRCSRPSVVTTRARMVGRTWCQGCQCALLAAQRSTPSGESTR